MDLDRLTASLRQHEGTGPFKDGGYFPYKDTTGNTTIGHGINLSAGITADEEAYLFSGRLQSAIREAQAQPWWAYVAGNDNWENALIELVWNMGADGVAGFHDMLDQLKSGNGTGASACLLNSLYARQVGQRAKDIAALFA